MCPRLLTPSQRNFRKEGTTIQLNQAEWLIVLRLARLWGFDALHDTAVKEIGNLVNDPIEKHELGKAHGVKIWMDEAIVARRGLAVAYGWRDS